MYTWKRVANKYVFVFCCTLSNLFYNIHNKYTQLG